MTPAAFPVTYLDWEAVLTRYYLSIGDGDASALRSFEVTGRTLAEAVGLDGEAGKNRSLEAFRSLFVQKEGALVEALRHGSYRKYPNEGVPGCFAYLALTMLVEGRTDPDASGHEFRPKLVAFLNLDRNFAHLSGINSMWIELRDWLQSQSDNGLPFRTLRLPEPDARVQIGYSVRLSFPSRRDKAVVQRFLDENDGILESPLDFLNRFRRVAEGARPSEDLRSAYEDFRQSYLRGERALSDHRFWRLVQAISLGRKTSTPFEVILEMVRDEDGLWSFILSEATSGGLIGTYATLDEAVATSMAQGLHGMSGAIDLGAIFFRQTGHARWEAMPALVEGLKRVFVGLSPRLAGKLGAKLGVLERSGEWSLTAGAVPAGRAQDFVSAFVKLPKPEEQIRDVRVFGGVRTAGSWLGRKSFLPKISADAAGLSILSRAGQESSVVSCEEETAGIYALRSIEPLDGSYIVEPVATAAGIAPSWSRNLTFVSDAHVHRSIPEPSGIPIPEWSDVVEYVDKVPAKLPAWSDLDPSLDDLIEAIYAGGRSGWNENELIPLVTEVLHGVASPWDFLRSLQEASMLAPHLKPGWKGRTWTLRHPVVVPLVGPVAGTVVIDGYVGKRLTQDFRDAAAAMGGVSFRSHGCGRWSPPLTGAAGVDVDELALRLGWRKGPGLAAGDVPNSFVQTELRHDFYVAASHWSWRRRRFVTERDDEAEAVRIARWTNRGNRDHDVYVVTERGRETRYAARSTAIAYAHVVGRVAMFDLRDDALVRAAAEGALPMPVAAWLRYRTLRNSGAMGMRQYAYPVQTGDIGKLDRLLPGVIDAAPSQTTVEAVCAARRSGGATRLIWTKENMTASRAASSLE